jgi:hypothetical protein
MIGKNQFQRRVVFGSFDKLRAGSDNGRRHRRGMHLDKRQRRCAPPNCLAVTTPDLSPPKIEGGFLERFTLAKSSHGQAATSLA